MPKGTVNATLGVQLRTMRCEKGVRQRDLAQALQVSQGTLSNWERGVHEPDTEMLKRLAGYFKVSVDEMLGYTQAETKQVIDFQCPLRDRPASSGHPADPLEALHHRLKALEPHTMISLISLVHAILDMLNEA